MKKGAANMEISALITSMEIMNINSLKDRINKCNICPYSQKGEKCGQECFWKDKLNEYIALVAANDKGVE